MLVLSRKLNEELRIGPDITIKVCRLRGGSVLLAVKAPREVPVVRAELKTAALAEAHRVEHAVNQATEAWEPSPWEADDEPLDHAEHEIVSCPRR